MLPCEVVASRKVPGGATAVASPVEAAAWRHRLADAVGGDPGATQSIYQALADRVFGYIRAQGIAEAEDVTSEVFLRVFRNLARFEGDEGDFRSWVFTIAQRSVIDARRAAGRRPVVIVLRDGHDPWGGETELEARLPLGGELRAAIADLTPDQRDVLFLRVVADLSLEETARTLGKPVGAVKSLQHRALAAARRSLVDRVAPA